MKRAWDGVLLAMVAVAVILIAGMLLFTSPDSVGVFGILLFLMAAYVLFLGLAVCGCRLFFRLRAWVDKSKRGDIQKKSYYYGAAIALAPLILLVRSSFGAIAIWDILLAIMVATILCFLIAFDVL